jgi:hypothetical protein
VRTPSAGHLCRLSRDLWVGTREGRRPEGKAEALHFDWCSGAFSRMRKLVLLRTIKIQEDLYGAAFYGCVVHEGVAIRSPNIAPWCCNY